MTLVPVELTRQELALVLALVRARHLEMQRMVQNIEESEGLDATQHNALRGLRPQLEQLEDLVLKLEGSARQPTA